MVKRSFTPSRAPSLAVLDVGSQKVCCWIAQLDETNRFRIVGSGHQETRGYSGGVVRNLEALEETIRGAVDDAERSCDEVVSRIIVSVHGALLHNSSLNVEVSCAGPAIGQEDVSRLLQEALWGQNDPATRTLHALAVSYELDGQRGIENPCGMLGHKLRALFHVISAPSARLKNFLLAIESSHLEPIALVSAPYAAGLSVLADDEMALGATVIDIGASGISVGVFGSNQLLATRFVPLGGQHITRDLAHGLETSLFHAERLKVLHGACFSTPHDNRELIKVPYIAGDSHATQTIARATLVDIIQPRVEEIFYHLKKKLFSDTTLPPFALQRVVLTGGGSQLPGLREVALTHLSKSVRLGSPQSMDNLSLSDRPEFAVISGLLAYSQSPEFQFLQKSVKMSQKRRAFFRRMASWFKENL